MWSWCEFDVSTSKHALALVVRNGWDRNGSAWRLRKAGRESMPDWISTRQRQITLLCSPPRPRRERHKWLIRQHLYLNYVPYSWRLICMSSRKTSPTSERSGGIMYYLCGWQFYCSHPWSHVVIGMWHKYPNPHCTHVQTIDVVDRTVDPETGIIRTERVLGCKQKAPTWIVKVCNRLVLSPYCTDPFV